MGPKKTSRPEFPPPYVVGPEEYDRLMAIAQDALVQLIATAKVLSLSRGQNTLKAEKEKNGSVFEMEHQQMKGTIQEVMNYYIADRGDTAKFKRTQCCADTELVLEIHPPSRKNPHKFLGIRWKALDQPSLFGAFTRCRDLCLLEFCTLFQDDNGRTGWARCVHSIEHPLCPDFGDTNGYLRCSVVNSGLVVMEAQHGVETLDCFMVYDIQARGKTSKWIGSSSVGRHFQAARNMMMTIQTERRTQVFRTIRANEEHHKMSMSTTSSDPGNTPLNLKTGAFFVPNTPNGNAVLRPSPSASTASTVMSTVTHIPPPKEPIMLDLSYVSDLK
ncbi:hypothetical protein SPRG_17253 [Saprolegnia parasitica CBS 223.65]|uniref:START domain-containing protein n=1 Tax=Saprolegnia parasitica (strain CBS 223.65) TaxID=695850 RepID=A0A067BKR2_SAPPC|nr:hypothetical protein SPRG_17253 [Saprolegnia parasitica CBS 223.65]KDO17300.1 hypothetical protein SPRG_17253 [Saprolegnia parasitica CBS 223.65]|eukprot:XP_012211993.1 hypothetical protein SPRG_17253 [Saprolegnia parasitica CBS 223.65]